jgi:hypothetical protein
MENQDLGVHPLYGIYSFVMIPYYSFPGTLLMFNKGIELRAERQLGHY